MLTGGCEALPYWGRSYEPPAPPALDAETQAVVGAVAYLSWFDGLPETNRTDVLTRAEQDVQEAPTQLNRLRLALLLCLPDTSTRDLERAHDLLGEVDGADPSDTARPLRRVLVRLIEENRKLESRLQERNDRLAELDKEAQQRQTTIEELEDKLNSLLKLEKGLQPQSTPTDLPPPPRGPGAS